MVYFSYIVVGRISPLMLKLLLICVVSVSLLLWGGCKKAGNANTGNWVGVYNSFNQHDSLNNIIISAAGDNLLKIEVKGVSGGYIYIYTTLHHVTINNPTQATINENTSISGVNGLYNVQGTLMLSGPDISLTATATSGADVKNITFTGSRQ
ncbi:MAG: hypothetical protein JWO03_2794 [Bacteroidetes bacterium]|nr:hypothetical protein [Bacteroidota bacterium]